MTPPTNRAASPATLLLADDHPLVLHGLRELLAGRPEFRVAAVCSDGNEAFRQIQALQPDIALIDVAMPGKSGLDVLSALGRARLKTRVVLLTASLTDAQVVEALAGGAHGIVFKDSASTDIVECVTAVLRGRRWLPERCRNIGGRLKRQEENDLLRGILTTREREIAVAAAGGASTKRIAESLDLSEGTVKNHLYNTYQKLRVRNRAELTAFILRHTRPDSGSKR